MWYKKVKKKWVKGREKRGQRGEEGPWKEKEEKRGCEADEEKMGKVGERWKETRKGDALQVSKVPARDTGVEEAFWEGPERLG